MPRIYKAARRSIVEGLKKLNLVLLRQDAAIGDIKVQVCIYAFDLLYINGVSLVREPLATRRDKLRGSFREVEGQMMFATSVTTESTEDIEVFLEESIKGGYSKTYRQLRSLQF